MGFNIINQNTLSGTGSVNQNLIPDVDNLYDIGSSSYRWKNLNIAGLINNLSLPTGTSTLVSLTANQTLTNKTLTNPTILSNVTPNATITFDQTNQGGITNATLVFQNPANATYTFPLASDSLVSLTGTETLLNKTITSPNITSANMTFGANLTGTFNCNLTGAAGTNIGNASSTTTVLGPLAINTSGNSPTQIGNGNSSLTIIAATTINSTGSSNTTIGNSVGTVGITNGSLALVTSGGTAATLNWYNTNQVVNTALAFSGPWGATTVTIIFRFSRIGNHVTVFMSGSSAAASATANINCAAGFVPTQFRPTIGVAELCVCRTINNSNASFGTIQMNIDGSITVYSGASAIANSWTASGSAGVLDTCFTYAI